MDTGYFMLATGHWKVEMGYGILEIGYGIFDIGHETIGYPAPVPVGHAVDNVGPYICWEVVKIIGDLRQCRQWMSCM